MKNIAAFSLAIGVSVLAGCQQSSNPPATAPATNAMAPPEANTNASSAAGNAGSEMNTNTPAPMNTNSPAKPN